MIDPPPPPPPEPRVRHTRTSVVVLLAVAVVALAGVVIWLLVDRNTTSAAAPATETAATTATTAATTTPPAPLDLTAVGNRCLDGPDPDLCVCLVEVIADSIGPEAAADLLEGTLEDRLGDGAFTAAVRTCTESPADQSAEPADTTAAPPRDGTPCTNAVFGFTIVVPPLWESRDGDTPDEQCRFVGPEGGGDATIIVSAVTNFTFTEMADGFQVPSLEETTVLNEEFVTPGGHRALRVEQETTSGAFTGGRHYHIVIDKPAPLWFFIQVPPSMDYSLFEEFIWAMEELAATATFE